MTATATKPRAGTPDTGAGPAAALSPIVGTLRMVPLEELHDSPLNPRKHYDPVALKQLADSMRATGGNVTAMLARPRQGGGYEIAAGHRRRRAAPLAGLSHLKVEWREMADQEFVELLQIENLQRDDLHPLEEAQGYRTLMEQCGYDIPRIGERIGKDKSYVYDRLKLLQLTKPAQELFLADRFQLGHAILLARLTPKDQERAIGRNDGAWGKVSGLFTVDYGDGALPFEKQDDEKRKPVSLREFRTWINDNIRFVPAKEDLPNLFPDAAVALEAAKEEELAVVKITRDYRVPDAAKDPKERTYGEAHWRRADSRSEPARFGERKQSGKPCAYAVLGVVVAGPGRGDAFKVCVNKDKCQVHWAAEQKERARRANQSGRGAHAEASVARHQAAERRKQEEEKAECERRRSALPALQKAVVSTLQRAPATMGSPLANLVLNRLRHHGRKLAFGFGPNGKDAQAVLRLAGFHILYSTISDE